MASHREEDNDLVVLKAGIDITSASDAACCCTKYYVTTVLEFQGYYEKYKFICRNTGFIVMNSQTLAETIESGPLCITDLFQNKSVAYF